MASTLAGRELPVFLADNHAETFGWITRTFDPDEARALVLVDAHSDASAVERSEEVREGLRRVPSEEARAANVEAWRKAGRVQAFNWIEPLMPRPLDQVIWLAAPEMDAAARLAATAEAAAQLDGRLEVEPRSAGTLANRWETVDLAGFTAWKPAGRPVILAIDLDFFAGMKAEDRERHFEAVWERAMEWPGLEGVAFAVSRPWLRDDDEADALVSLAVDAVRRTRGARLEIDASIDDRPDDSRQAKERVARGESIPRWDLGRSMPHLRMSLAQMGDRLTIRDRGIDWTAVPLVWSGMYGSGWIRPASGEIDCDRVWRFPRGGEPVLRVEASPGATGKVRWFSLEPASIASDLLPETGLGKAFSKSPSRWIYEKRRSLGVTGDFQLAPEAWAGEPGGRFRIEAEYEAEDGWLPVPPIELRIRTADGFRGSLSECGRMPYVFGIAGVAEGDLSGVETGWGSDCSNLLIHAWRRNGIPLDWGDPGRLREQLATKAESVRAEDRVAISAGELEKGIVIDFGQHVAALWEDRKPLGMLDGNDLVLHHLGGLPEILPLSELAATRPVFALRVPQPTTGCRVAFAGDVVLAGGDRVVIDGFERGKEDLFLANLEGVPSLRVPETATRFDFRFPPERLGWLKERGVDAVSLANNHAADAGQEGMLEGMSALEKAGIPSFGAGRDADAACRPWRVERKGVKLAVFGVYCSSMFRFAPGSERSVVARLPEHAATLEREMATARAKGERILVMCHGGEEYDSRVSNDQRHWARWLVARGARVVAGAHPHVVQRAEFHGGARVFHSLGNAVYPKALKGADSGKVEIVEIP